MSKKHKDKVGVTAGWLAVALLVLWGVWFWGGRALLHLVTGIDGTVEKAGLMGDSFGAINTLFTGFAMIGAVGSLAYQQKTLRDQQAAQIEQQKEIAGQQKRFQENHIEQLKARFEQSFFELLTLSRELRGKIQFTHSQRFKTLTRLAGEPIPATGDAAFSSIKSEVLEMWQTGVKEVTPLEGEHPVGAFYTAWVHRQNEDHLGPYFRIIYSMLRRIFEAQFLTNEEKIAYGNLLRSQLTSTELFVIGVNGLAHVSGDLHDYLEEFRMFKYLPDNDKDMFLSTWSTMQPTYAQTAFEGRQGKDV